MRLSLVTSEEPMKIEIVLFYLHDLTYKKQNNDNDKTRRTTSNRTGNCKADHTLRRHMQNIARYRKKQVCNCWLLCFDLFFLLCGNSFHFPRVFSACDLPNTCNSNELTVKLFCPYLREINLTNNSCNITHRIFHVL